MSVSTMRMRLSQQDIERLVRAPDPEDRARAAHKICRMVAAEGLATEGQDAKGLNDAERAAARQILDHIMADTAELVRRALAVTLKASPHLPRDLALRLIEDADSVAAPVLEHSPVLNDDDLIRIIESGHAQRQTVVARREALTARVVRAIAEKGCAAAVSAAAANDGATFDRPAFIVALQRFGGDPAVTDGFIARRRIPVDIAEKLVSLVNDEALKRLASRHELPPQMAVELSEETRERATIDLIDQAERSSDLQRLVQQLNLNGRLTASITLRAACVGSMTFFEHCMAELAGLPHQKAWVLVHDSGPLGLRAIFERAGLPERIFPALRTALDVCHETETEGDAPSDSARRRHSQRVIQRILTQRQSFTPDDLDYLLNRLDAQAGPAEAEAAQAA